ncbi:PaaI family thioesterase [Desulfobacterota bacterium AH_259_B03_O07]|nr:PaaI family thioesterase [Desulfobacterota bacterium AH_259_B03_O07]
MGKLAFQDYMEMNKCWGCGSTNKNGLQIKSYWSGDESVCTWIPKKEHMAGPTNILNGGIIATIIDCHSVSTAIAAAYREEGRGTDTKPFIWYVTASIKIDYRRPAQIDKPVNLRAEIKKVEGRKTFVNCSLFSDRKECARAELLAIRVPSEDWYK